MKALSAKLHPVVSASAIIANGEVVLGLPDQKEAVRTLSAILRRFTPPGGNATVYFKEEVKVETRDIAPAKLFATAEAALEQVEQSARPKGRYEVKPGDSAWKIAGEHDVPLSRLAAANPEVDLNRVRAGQRLNIPGELPPLTVVARKEVSEPLGEGPEAPVRKIRMIYENGALVSREVIGRPPRRVHREGEGAPAEGRRGETIR